MDGAGAARPARTANRMLSAMMGFYEFHARRGSGWRSICGRRRAGRGAAAGGGVLGRIATARPRRRAGRLPEARRLPRPLSVAEVAVIAAQRRPRDRFLCALLFGTGMRIGQALGLRGALAAREPARQAHG
jgi:integrase/recombinase XerD